MRKFVVLFSSVLAGASLFGAADPRAASQLYSKPTYAQVMRLTAAVRGEPIDHGPWSDGSIPASRLYSTPTYAQVERLIATVKAIEKPLVVRPLLKPASDLEEVKETLNAIIRAINNDTRIPQLSTLSAPFEAVQDGASFLIYPIQDNYGTSLVVEPVTNRDTQVAQSVVNFPVPIFANGRLTALSVYTNATEGTTLDFHSEVTREAAEAPLMLTFPLTVIRGADSFVIDVENEGDDTLTVTKK